MGYFVPTKKLRWYDEIKLLVCDICLFSICRSDFQLPPHHQPQLGGRTDDINLTLASKNLKKCKFKKITFMSSECSNVLQKEKNTKKAILPLEESNICFGNKLSVVRANFLKTLCLLFLTSKNKMNVTNIWRIQKI